ncbi:uncharacterized protein CGFF_05088 [Nakaseomyces glabratus]|nr:uncharacterized protein CGFF_05088 [Nakaseomyces glabratus]SLM17301.1 uncharacterized protein CGFF_05088 [Nakaseomyces glabratus]
MWSIYVLLISLISRVLSATDGSFVISDPTYVYNGDINVPDAGYILNNGAIAKEITVNGNINVATYFSVVSGDHGVGPGYFFTYHGGSISAPGNGIEISNDGATGPTTIVMTGDSFTGRGFYISSNVREGSTAYLDFDTINAVEHNITDAQYVTFSPRTKFTLSPRGKLLAGEFWLQRTDVFFEGAVDFMSNTEMDLYSSSVWIDNPDEANLAGDIWMYSSEPNVNSLNVKDSIATKPLSANIHTDYYRDPFYLSFDTTVQSLKWTDLKSEGFNCYYTLTVQTDRNTHEFKLFTAYGADACQTFCLSLDSFKTVKRTVDRNGTMVELDSVYFDPTAKRNCPELNVRKVDTIEFEPCTYFETYEKVYTKYYYVDYDSTRLNVSYSCPYYTTTVLKDGKPETDIITYYVEFDNMQGATIHTKTITIYAETPEADYTTTYTSDGHTITEVVSHITTTDSDGKTVTITTTMASFDQVDEGVFTSPEPYSQPPVVTSTVTEDDGSSKTVVISYFPSEGEDGVTRTGTTTVSTIIPEEPDYTTTIDKGNGELRDRPCFAHHDQGL